MANDKRQFPRVNESARLKWRVADPSDLLESPPIDDGLQINISGGGIAFFADVAPKMGATLAIKLDLPGYPSSIIALARAVWIEPSSRDGAAGFDVGAEFHWIGWDSNFAQQQIASYVKERLSR